MPPATRSLAHHIFLYKPIIFSIMKLFTLPVFCFFAIPALGAIGQTSDKLCISQQQAAELQNFQAQAISYEHQLESIEPSLIERNKNSRLIIDQTHDLLDTSKEISAKLANFG